MHSMTLPRPSRLLVVAGLALALLTIGLPLAPRADAFTYKNGVRLNAVEARLLYRINAARTARGISALRVVPGYTDVARRWAYRQASAQRMAHNPNMASQLQAAGGRDWRIVGENVGYGWDADSLFTAYWNSAPHRANLLNPSFRYVGMGWVERADGTGYNTQNFVNSYSTTYGRSRVAAYGGKADSRTLSSTTALGSFERGADARLATQRSSGLSGTVAVDRPVSGVDNAARFTARETAAGTGGRVGMVIRDSVHLRHATSVSLKVRATSRTGRPVVVEVYLRTVLGHSVRIGAVKLTSGKGRWITLPLPDSAKAWRNDVFVAVPRTSLQSLSSTRTDRVARVAIYRIQVNV